VKFLPSRRFADESVRATLESGSKFAGRNARATLEMVYKGQAGFFVDLEALEGLVARVIRRRSNGLGLIVVLILSAAILPAAAGQGQHSSRSHAQGRFARAADKTFREGLQAKLPPHLSTLLGLSAEEDCPVMQGVVRTGNVVQGFDVSVRNKNDIVLFVVDESANDQTLYLTSPAGTLRKLVSVKAGEGDVARITDKDRKAFEKEKRFWVDRLAPVGTSK